MSETGQVNGNRLDWTQDRVKSLARMPSLDHGQAYELRQLERELAERTETLARVEAETAEIQRRMLEA